MKILISEYGLDPWLLNKNNQSPFDLLDPITNPNVYNQLLILWTRKAMYKVLFTDLRFSIRNPDQFTIFDKIHNTMNDTLTNKIYKYI